MKGLIPKALAGACGAAALAVVGCGELTYRDIVDPCYPARYNAAAKREVNDAMAPQMHNGHALDQTVWNEHFEAGGDKLTSGGQEHLKYLARRRPAPDPMIFLQTAQDVAYDPAKPEDYTAKRAEINSKRIQAVQSFLGAYANGLPFQVVVHDPGETGQSAVGVGRAATQMHNSYQGSLPAAGVGAAGGAGAAAGGGGAAAGGVR